MYKVIKMGYIMLNKDEEGQKTERILFESTSWKVWRTTVTENTCFVCASMNGKIIAIGDSTLNMIPVHPNCRCNAEIMIGIVAGTATSERENGVEKYVALNGKLPEYYVLKETAEAAGWKSKRGNLSDVMPGRVIGGDYYKNRDGRLPTKPGRIWREADFDYTGGFRNNNRLIYSNDGLLFVTYDHYRSFYEIGLEY